MRRASLAILCLLAACNPQPGKSPRSASPAATTSATPAGPPPLKITSRGTAKQPLVFFGHKGSRTAYKMLASRSEVNTSQGAGDGTFYDVDVTFYDPSGKTMTASAPRAVAVEAAQTLTLYDGVRAKSSNGYALTCRTLRYDRKSGMLHGEGGVRIESGSGFTGTGNRFDSDIGLEKMSMQ